MSQSLEIHHINVGGGDCTVIVLRADPTKPTTIKKILIDGGCSRGQWRSLAAYLKKYFDNRPFDYMIASHYHDDHITGLPYAGIKFKMFVDIGGYEVDTKIRVDFTPKRKSPATSSLGYYNNYANLIGSQVRENSAKRVNLPFLEAGNHTAGPVEITIAKDITLTCYCGDGYLANGTDVIVDQNKGSHPAQLDDNDLSLGFLLKWDKFIYYTAADLSGDTTRKTYYNIEAPLVAYLKKDVLKGTNVTVAKASHHGSDHSTYPAYSSTTSFFDSMKPDTIIVSSNIHKGVPGTVYLKRAGEYCKTNKKTILFANDLVYAPTASQYAPLKKIISDKIDSNLRIDSTNDTQLLNDGPTAVVVQVKSDNTVKDLALGTATKVLKRVGYTLYIDNSDLPGVTKQALTARGITLPLFFDDDGTLDVSIQNGFEEQAKEIESWIETDITQMCDTTQQWLDFNMPALKVADLVTAVKTDKKNAGNKIKKELNTLFDTAYKKKLVSNKTWYEPDNEAGRFTKQTLNFLLVKNPNQVKLNKQSGWVSETKSKQMPDDFDYSSPVMNKKTKAIKRKQVEATLVDNPRRSKRRKTDQP
jgi:hypothetical protein